MLTIDKAANNYFLILRRLSIRIYIRLYIFYYITLIPFYTDFDHQDLFKCVHL